MRIRSLATVVIVALALLVLSTTNVPILAGPARAIIAIIIVVTVSAFVIISRHNYPPFI